MGGGLVEDDDPLTGQQQPGDGHALALAAGEAVAALADHCVQAVGQGADEVVETGAAQGVPQFLVGRRGAGQEEVGADRVVEEVTVLGDHAEGGPQGGEAQVAHVDAADAYGALVDVVQTGQQLGDGRLAGAGGADEGHGLSGLGAEGDAVQDLGAGGGPLRPSGAGGLREGVGARDLLQGGEGDLVGGRVGEADVLELDRDRAVRHLAGVRLLLDQRFEVQHLEDALEADQGAHHLHARPGERRERRVQPGQEQGQGDDRARFQGAAQGEEAAEAVDQGQGQGGHQGQRGDERGLRGRGADADVPHPAGADRELLRLLLGAAEELDQGGAGGGEALGHAGAHRRVEGGRLPLHPGHAAAHPAGRHHEHRQQHQGEQRDLPGEREHDGEGEQKGDHIAHHAGQGVAEGPLGADDVVVETGDERSGTRAREERDRHPLYMVEHGRPQIEDQSLAERGRQTPAEDAEHRLGHRDQCDEQGQPYDRARIASRHDRVDDTAGEHRGRHGEQGGDHPQGDEQRDTAAVGAGERADAAQGRAGERTALLPGVQNAVQLRPGGGLHAHNPNLESQPNVRSRFRLRGRRPAVVPSRGHRAAGNGPLSAGPCADPCRAMGAQGIS
ncbi:hypothetical protein GCM10009564_31160 [Streptomyces thermogriseus]|uniref:Uncharacterized protein n=1 Tax=Streptomyces thermogriseus TaxID=75292 RepID=A0ABP4DL37_9ACTN